jgi:hypothetical protein
MLGGMQDFELRVPRLIDHAAREHGEREIVSYWADGTTTRSNWAGVAYDARRLAQALEKAGVKRGDRVATLAMNHGRHFVDLVRRDRHGRGDPHRQSAPVRRAARLYLQPCRRPRSVLRQGVPADRRPAESAMADDHALCRVRFRRCRWLRGADRGRGWRLCLGRGARARAVHALLYQRHHRQSQGRALRASLDDDPHDDRDISRCLRSGIRLGGAADRADVPRRGMGPALCRRAVGHQVRLFRGQRRCRCSAG